MKKKICILGIMIAMVFLFTACNRHTIIRFDGLDEMQAVLPNNFCFFELENADFSNAEFSATKLSRGRIT